MTPVTRAVGGYGISAILERIMGAGLFVAVLGILLAYYLLGGMGALGALGKEYLSGNTTLFSQVRSGLAEIGRRG